jgi:hypothetical protein
MDSRATWTNLQLRSIRNETRTTARTLKVSEWTCAPFRLSVTNNAKPWSDQAAGSGGAPLVLPQA